MEQTNDHASLASSNQEMDTASYPFRSNGRRLDYYQWDNERNWRSCLKQGMRERGGCRPINCAKAYCLLHARGHLIPAHAWYTTPSPSIPMMFTNHSSGSTMTVPSISTVEFHFHCPRIWVLISKGERERKKKGSEMKAKALEYTSSQARDCFREQTRPITAAWGGLQRPEIRLTINRFNEPPGHSSHRLFFVVAFEAGAEFCSVTIFIRFTRDRNLSHTL